MLIGPPWGGANKFLLPPPGGANKHFLVIILYVCYYYDDNNHYLIITFQVPVVRVEICFESLTKISGQGRLGAPQVQVILMMVGISVVLA